jgi:hypothetical protein
METYLAYFDILGFKEFMKREDEEIVQMMNCLKRDSQAAIANQDYVKASHGGLVANLVKAEVNCLHISDSILFWTNDSTLRSFEKIFNAASYFLQACCVLRTFPVRGCIVKGQIHYSPFTFHSHNQTAFTDSSMYGNALIEAYTNAEEQNWAGCYIHESAQTEQQYINSLIASNKLFRYPVPLKSNKTIETLALPLYGETVSNIDVDGFKELFNQYNNGLPLNPSVIVKLDNTTAFFRFTKSKDASIESQRQP